MRVSKLYMRIKHNKIIIILLALLVILPIVVRILFNIFTTAIDGGRIDIFASDINILASDITAFLNKCEKLCIAYRISDISKVKVAYPLMPFCSVRLFPPGTMRLLQRTQTDAITSKVIPQLPLVEPWPVCEDAIFCPHLYVCSKNNETITWSKCREHLCEYYGKGYEDPAIVNQRIVEGMQNRAKYPWGSCELPRDENWWYKYFGDEPCTNPP